MRRLGYGSAQGGATGVRQSVGVCGGGKVGCRGVVGLVDCTTAWLESGIM